MRASPAASIPLLLLIAGAWGCAGTTRTAPVTPGARVRVTAPALGLDREVSEVGTISGDSIVLRSGARGQLRLPLDRIERLEVSRGEARAVKKGAVIGGAVGGLVGAFVGAGNYEPCPPNSFFCMEFGPGLDIMAGAGVGLIAGAAAGGLLGSLVRIERWERASVTVSPSRAGGGGGSGRGVLQLRVSVPVGGGG